MWTGGCYFYRPGFILYNEIYFVKIKYCLSSILSTINTSLVYLKKNKNKLAAYSLVNAPTRQIYKMNKWRRVEKGG